MHSFIIEDSKIIESHLNKIWGFVGGDRHIIRAHPKNPRRGADIAAAFKKDVFPEIVSDVTDYLCNKRRCGDVVDENTVRLELIFRINTELIKFGIASLPLSGK